MTSTYSQAEIYTLPRQFISGFDLYTPGSDQWKTQFKAIDCPTVSGINGNIKFRFVESNPWAMKLQTRNSRQVLSVIYGPN